MRHEYKSGIIVGKPLCVTHFLHWKEIAAAVPSAKSQTLINE